MINQNFYKTFAIELGSQDLDHGSWIIQIWIWFNGFSLSPLHTFGKFNKFNTNYLIYLFASAFTMFNVFFLII